MLLLPKARVDGDQSVEEARHRVQQVPVVEVPPAHLGSGSDLVCRQTSPETSRNARVEKDSHVQAVSDLRRCGALEKCRLRELKHGNRVLTRNAREILEKGA